MKKIALTKGEFAIVDNDDFEELSKYKWFVSLSHKKTKYAVRMLPTVNNKRQHISMHRQILKLERIKGHKIEVDHIDRNGLNNQKLNLRKTTGRINQLNTGLRTDNTTGYKGIWFDPSRNKWQAHIRTGKKLKRIGRFSTKEQAAEAYKNYVNIFI